MRDDPARARALLDALRHDRPDSPGIHLGEALFAAAQGDEAGARQWLVDGIGRWPAVRDFALAEPSLAHLVPPA
jgi:hypothetical protein